MPECYADTLLMETLVPPETGYSHKHNCFKVESSMKWTDSFAVGIIDNDKKQITYLTEFFIVSSIEGSLVLQKHKIKPQYIIQICPALEKWILNVCRVEKIDLANFGLPHDFKLLRNRTKKMSSLKDDNLKNLFNAIAETDDNVSVNKLRYWVKYLKEKNYNADINELKNG